MPRERKKYRLFPNSDRFAANTLTKIGSATHDYEEIAKRGNSEWEGGEAPKKPSTATGLKGAEKGNSAGFDIDKLTLASGETVFAASLHVYCKQAVASVLRFGNAASGGTPEVDVPEQSALVTPTAEAWSVIAFSEANAKRITQTVLNTWGAEGASAIFLMIEKAKEAVIYSFYLEVETETETAQVVRNSGQKATKAPEGGGAISVSIATPPVIGNYLHVGVQTGIGIAAATTITDNQGSTWSLDGEVNDGVHPTMQAWKAKVASATISEVKVNGLPSLTLVNAAVIETTPISELDTSGVGTGVTILTSTELEAATSSALQAGKGDFGLAWFGSTGSLATFTAGSGMTALTPADQTGLSLGGEYTSTPAEGAVLTAKGTFSATGTWTGIVIAYKVLSSGPVVHTIAATLSFAGVLPRATAHQVQASASFAGVLQRSTAHGLSASLTPSGLLQRGATHQLPATLSFAGVLARKTAHAFSGGLSFLGALTPQEVGHFVHRIEAVLGLQGTLGRKTTRRLAAGLSPQGALQRSTSRRLGAAVSFSAVLPRASAHQIAASLSPAGTLGRIIRMPFAASLGFAGRLAFKGARALGLAGLVNPFQRRGRSSPLSRLGRGNPRPAHKTPSLYPDEGLYPEDTLYPGGGEIEPD